MTDLEMTRADFAEVVHASVHGVVGLYDQVGLLLVGLRDALGASVQPLVGRHAVRAHHHDYKRSGTSSAVKRLPPWYGYLFVSAEGALELDEAESEDGEADDEAEPKGTVDLHQGQRLLYAKAVIYSPVRTSPVEPALLTGIMTVSSSVEAEKTGQPFRMKKKGARYTLEAIHGGLGSGTLKTNARVEEPVVQHHAV